MSDRPIALLELAITGLLAQQPRSGYDLLKVFSETAMGGFSSSPGAIYPALKRLEKAGSITGDVENRDTLRPRQVYSLSAAGVETLKWQLRQPVTRDDIVRHADGIMLRFAFAGEVLGSGEAIRILEGFAQEIECYLPELKAQLGALPETGGAYGACALQHGIDMYSADARWARKVVKELKQRARAWKAKRRTVAPRQRKRLKRGGRKS